jgi:hypothetical protein
MKFFLAAYSGDPGFMDEGVLALARGFEGGILGEPDIQSRDIPMTDTDYYTPEMGPGLMKRYLSFPNHLPPEALVDLKLWAMEEERRGAVNGKRRLNLDPGYVFSGGLVLSTGKFSGHRLYLGRGVWGELTLLYRDKSFRALPWSYKDYLTREVTETLSRMRAIYFEKEKQEKLNRHD